MMKQNLVTHKSTKIEFGIEIWWNHNASERGDLAELYANYVDEYNDANNRVECNKNRREYFVALYSPAKGFSGTVQMHSGKGTTAREAYNDAHRQMRLYRKEVQ